jgi:hypothetical protein
VFEFFLFMLIVLGFIAGSSFVYVLTIRMSKRLDTRPTQPMDSLLREEIESLTVRLGRVEDELEFYKRLQAPEEPDS